MTNEQTKAMQKANEPSAMNIQKKTFKRPELTRHASLPAITGGSFNLGVPEEV